MAPRSLGGVGKLLRFRAVGPQLVWGGQDLTRGLDVGALPPRPQAGYSGAESGMQALEKRAFVGRVGVGGGSRHIPSVAAQTPVRGTPRG